MVEWTTHRSSDSFPYFWTTVNWNWRSSSTRKGDHIFSHSKLCLAAWKGSSTIQDIRTSVYWPETIYEKSFGLKKYSDIPVGSPYRGWSRATPSMTTTWGKFDPFSVRVYSTVVEITFWRIVANIRTHHEQPLDISNTFPERKMQNPMKCTKDLRISANKLMTKKGSGATHTCSERVPNILEFEVIFKQRRRQWHWWFGRGGR